MTPYVSKWKLVVGALLGTTVVLSGQAESWSDSVQTCTVKGDASVTQKAVDEVSALLSPLSFNGQESFCSYACELDYEGCGFDKGSSNSNALVCNFCRKHCTCQDREESNFELLKCNDKSLKCTLELSSVVTPFQSCSSLSPVLDSVTEDGIPFLADCSVTELGTGDYDDSLWAADPTTKFTYLVVLDSAPFYEEDESVPTLARVQEALQNFAGTSNIRWIAGSRTSYYVTVSNLQADALREWAGVERVVKKPAASKIQRSLVEKLSALQRGSDFPRLDIQYIGSSAFVANEWVKLINQQINDLTGVKNAVTRDSRGRIAIQSIKSPVHYAIMVSLLVQSEFVNYIYIQKEISLNLPDFVLPGEGPSLNSFGFPFSATSASRPRRLPEKEEDAKGLSKHQSRSRRRLDSMTASILGVESSWKRGVNGSSVVVLVADTGLYMYHEQFLQNTIPYDEIRLDERKVVQYVAYADKYDQSDDPTGKCGHGTHVAGIVAGSRAERQQILEAEQRAMKLFASTDTPTGSSSASDGSFLNNTGIAPGAKLSFFDIGSVNNITQRLNLEVPSNPASVIDPAISAGVSIASFSWGTTAQKYDNLASEFDGYLYTNKNILVVMAAGNNGDGLQPGLQKNCGGGVIATPATSKNVLTVGASFSSCESFGGCFCNVYNTRNVAPFSSWGPAPDGRRKPDVVCPGSTVFSAQSLSADSYANQTVAKDLCPIQGTSQSAPACAGVAALVEQYLKEGWWFDGKKNLAKAVTRPPSSLIKAFLIHSTVELKSYVPDARRYPTCAQLQTALVPTVVGDSIQGFGLVQASNVLIYDEDTRPRPFFVPQNDNQQYSVGAQEVYEFQFNDVSRSRPFRATLVWTDPPGERGTCAPVLVNDLDLEVVDATGKSAIYYYPVGASNTPDKINNVEVVIIPASTDSSGDTSFIVRVIGSQIRVGGRQEFSLLVSSPSAFASALKPAADALGSRSWEASSAHITTCNFLLLVLLTISSSLYVVL